MKASEISMGMRVAIKEGGRSSRILGHGIVVGLNVSRDYSGRVDATRVRRITEDGGPVFQSRWDTELKKMVATDEPMIVAYRNAQLISDADWKERQAKAQAEQAERLRIREIREGVIDGVKESMAKLGISKDDVHVRAIFVPAEGDDPEGVEIHSIDVSGDSVIALQNLVNKEVELLEMNGD